MKKDTEGGPLTQGPTIEVSEGHWEINQNMLEDMFETFASAVLGYKVLVNIEPEKRHEDAIR
jgi:hypothetical protein